MQNLSNLPQLQTAQISDKIKSIFRVMAYGFYIDNANNISEELLNNVSSTQTTYSTLGNFGGFTGYVVIENEIIEVISSIFDGASTSFVFKRGQLNTKASYHISGCIIRSVQDITSLIYEYQLSEETESITNNLFNPVVSTGAVYIFDDTRKWLQFNPNREYNLNRKNVLYFFEGAGSELVCRHTLFLDDWDTNNKDSEISIILKDKFIFYYNEKISQIKSYKDITVKEFLSDILNINQDRIIYSNNLTESDFKKIDEINTKNYKTYDQLLLSLCKDLGIRMAFNSREELVLYSDLIEIDPSSNGELDQDVLLDINETSDNQLIINKIIGKYSRKRGFYNINDFPNPIIYKTNFQTDGVLIVQNENGDYLFNTINNIVAGSSIKYLKIGSYVKFKDVINGDEFFGFVIKISQNDNDISLSEIDVTMGYDKDFVYSQFGRIQDLSSIYTASRTFTVYVGRNELPYVWEYVLGEKSTNINFPLLPNESLKLQGKFGGIETSDEKFTGIIEDLDIYDIVYDNSELKYQQELSQTVPIYLRSNSQTIVGSGEDQRINYTSFDNSNIQILFERSTDSSYDFDVTLVNNKSGSSENNFVPIAVDGVLMEVININSYNTGDVFKLQNNFTNEDTDRINTFLNYKNGRWVVQAKFIDSEDGKHYLIFDSNLPVGSNNAQMYFTRYIYDGIILLQELSIRGNPVVEKKEDINWENTESITKYGEKSYSLEGSFIKEADLNDMSNYITNGFAGTELSNTKFIIPFELSHRYDLELLDVITINDNIYTGLSEQKAVITKVITSNIQGKITQQYEALTINDYDNTADIILKSNYIYQPLTITEYNHNGNESLIENFKLNTENQIVRLFDPVFGEVMLLKINQDNLTAKVKSSIVNNSKTLEIKEITGNEKDNLEKVILYQDKDLFIKINGEFIYCTSLQDVDSNDETKVNINQRAMFETLEQQIKANDLTEFYKIISMSNNDGFYTTQMLAGDLNQAYIKVDGGEIEIKGNVTITAGETYDKIENTNKTFKSDSALYTPTPPYNLNDIWVLYQSDNFKICVNSKSEGESYSSSDWASATTIDSTVFNLERDLSDLNSNILEYNDDGKITLAEAKAIDRQLSQIKSESEEFISEAEDARNNISDTTIISNINTAISNYRTSVLLLESYINTYYVKKSGDSFITSQYPISTSSTNYGAVETRINDTQTKKAILVNLISEGRSEKINENLSVDISAQDIRIAGNEAILNASTGKIEYGTLKLGAQGVNTASGAGLSFVGGNSLFKIDSVNNFVDLITTGDLFIGTFQSGYYPNALNINNDNKSYLHLNVGSTGNTSNYLQLGQTTSTNYLTYSNSGLQLKGDFVLGTDNEIILPNSKIKSGFSDGYFTITDLSDNQRLKLSPTGVETVLRIGYTALVDKNIQIAARADGSYGLFTHGDYTSGSTYIKTSRADVEFGLKIPRQQIVYSDSNKKGSICIDNTNLVKVHDGTSYKTLHYSDGNSHFTGNVGFYADDLSIKTMVIENGLIKNII